MSANGKHVGRCDLGRRVDGLQVAGKPAGDAQPLRPLVRMHALRQPRPTDRELAAERGRADGLDVSDELLEQTSSLSLNPSARRNRR